MSVRLLFLRLGLIMGMLTSASSVFADLEPSSAQVKLGMRYNSQFEKEHLEPITGWFQYQAVIKYNLGLAATPIGDFTLRGVAGTGRSFTSAWNSFASTLDRSVPNGEFNMRQIYLEDVIDDWALQAGVIPPNGGDIPTLGYDTDGYVRGGRIVAPLGEGSLTLVTGAIDHLDDPNAFNSWDEWNYVGARLVQPLPLWGLRGAVSYEYLTDQNYAGVEIARKWKLDEGVGLTGALEAMHNFTTPSWAWAAAAKLSTDPVNVVVAYTYINPDFGLRGELSNDFFTLGHRVSLNFNGELFIKDLRWFVQNDLTEDRVRIRAGFSYAFGAGEPGYLARFD